MKGTAHERGAHDAMLRFLERPGGGQALAATVRGIREGHWPEHYVASIGQDHGYHSAVWPMEQVHAFAVIDAWIQAGSIAVADIRVGATPEADARRDENQAALDNLHSPFTAEVYEDQHCGDCDGVLRWDAPIAVSARVTPGTWLVQDSPHWVNGRVARIGEIPLEIGDSKASTTAFHLAAEGAVARWPYGHQHVRILLDTERFPLLSRKLNGEIAQYSPSDPLRDAVDPLPHDDRSET